MKDEGVTGQQFRARAAVELERVEPRRKAEFAVAADVRGSRVDVSARLILEKPLEIALDLAVADQGSVGTRGQQDGADWLVSPDDRLRRLWRRFGELFGSMRQQRRHDRPHLGCA